MSKVFYRTAITVGLVACFAIPALGQGPGALTWTYEGSSGFATAAAPSDVTYIDRAMPHDMIMDDNGRIYTTANAPTSIGTGGGALSIYEPDGSGGWTITDVDLNAAGYNGVVTKFIKVDGVIYALQNYYPAQWWESDTWQMGYDFPDRILRVNSNGSVNLIIDVGMTVTERIVDISCGPDGDSNIYMTRNGDLHDWFYFQRIDVSGPGPYTVDDTANSPKDQGWGERHTYWDLEYAGKMNDGTDMWINPGYHRGYYYRNPAGIGWASGYDRQSAYTTGGADATLNPDFGFKDNTAMAYSNASKQLWMGGRSWEHWKWAWETDTYDYGSLGSDATAAGGSDASEPGSADEATLVGTKTAGNSQYWFMDVGFGAAHGYWSDPVPNPMSMEIRFKINSYSTSPDPTYSAYLLELGPHGDSATTGRPSLVAVYFDGNDGHLKFQEITYDSGTDTKAATTLADMGAISTGTWYEVNVVMDYNALTAKCWLDGVSKYDGSVNPLNTWQDGSVGFGAAVDIDHSGIGGTNDLYVPGNETAEVAFDYAVLSLGDEVLPSEPDSEWPTQPIDEGGFAAAMVDGRVLPENWQITNIMARFNGDITADGFFIEDDGLNHYVGPVDAGSMWHVNLSFPATSNQPNAHYWMSAMSVNPKDGSGWMSWGGHMSFDGSTVYEGSGEWGPVGNVYRMDRESSVPTDEDLASNNLGAPQAAHTDSGKADNRSHVEDVIFDGDTVYALVVDVETGEYNLFSATNPATSGACCLPDGCSELAELECLAQGGVYQGDGVSCAAANCEFQVCHDPFADADGDGDVDQDDFARFQICFTGNSGDPLGTYPPQNCECFDTDGDGDVDGADFTAFQNCASGPGIAADPERGNSSGCCLAFFMPSPIL